MKNAETPIEILKRLKASLVATRLGVKFYEDPIHGDEEPLLAVYKGRVVCSGFYDVPEEDVCIDIMNEIEAVIEDLARLGMIETIENVLELK